MSDHGDTEKHGGGLPEMPPGALGHLLDEIEREAVPERLLHLALQLQAALQRDREHRRAGRDEAARV